MLPSNLTNGLKLYLDGTVSGTTAVDQSGNGNSGTLVGSPTLQGVLDKNAFVLNGSSQYISVDSINTYFTGTKSYTLNMWVKTSASGVFQRFFGAYNSGGGATRALYVSMHSDGTLYAGRQNGTIENTTALGQTRTINNGQWHMITTRYDGSYLRVYVDGYTTGCIVASTITASTGDRAQIGVNLLDAGYYWNGQLASPRLYNRDLTLQEIQQLAYYKPLNCF